MMDSKKNNPWMLIWTRPKDVWPIVVNQSYNPSILFLGMLTGASILFIPLSTLTFFSISLVIALSILFGSLAGLINLYLLSSFLKWTSGWLGSTASYSEIRAICAWASAPLFLNLVIWTIGRNFPSAGNVILYVTGFLCVWAVVLLISGLNVAIGFSTVRAVISASMAGAPVLFLYIVFIGALMVVQFQGYKQTVGAIYQTGYALSGK